MATFAERLKLYMDRENLKQIDIVNRCKHLGNERGVKLNRSDISQYLSGTVTPGTAKLNLIADSFLINPAWLEGYDVPMVDLKIDHSVEQKRWIEKRILDLGNASLNPRLVKALDAFFDLPNEDFYKVIEYIELLDSKNSVSESDNK